MVMIVMNDDDDDRVVPERALSIRLLEVSGWFACPLERYHSKVERTCLGRSNCSPFSGGRGGAYPGHEVRLKLGVSGLLIAWSTFSIYI